MAEDSEDFQKSQSQKVTEGAGKNRMQSEHQRNGRAVSVWKAWAGFQH